MRPLKLKGYLMSQLKFLSGENTTSLYKYAKLAEENPRLNDVLCMYLTLCVDEKLRKRLENYHLCVKKGCQNLRNITESNLPDMLDNPDLSQYKTIYDNYLYASKGSHNDDKIKRIMHSKILLVQKEKQISNYRIYTELNLNAGNTNSFLKNSDIDKMSLATIRRILSFVNSYSLTTHP